MCRFYNSHSLQIYLNEIWHKHSCTTRVLIGFIHFPADHTNLFVALGSRTGSSGDVPSGNPQKIYKWMNYNGRDFQWSIHSPGYLCNFWRHHNQEKRNSHLHMPSGLHHKLQKQNMVYLKVVIILVWGEILPLFIQVCSRQKAHVLIRSKPFPSSYFFTIYCRVQENSCLVSWNLLASLWKHTCKAKNNYLKYQIKYFSSTINTKSII